MQGVEKVRLVGARSKEAIHSEIGATTRAAVRAFQQRRGIDD